jgi:hypothetical protein
MVQSGERRMRVATARQGIVERRAPLLEGGPIRAGFVAQIVAVAHEGIHGAHGIALLA